MHKNTYVNTYIMQLYDGTMAHCGWWFLWALPSPTQRLSKALQFCMYLPYVGLLAACDEGRAEILKS